MTRADDVIDNIDHALQDWRVSGDAMRWTPELDPLEAANNRREWMWARYGQPRIVSARHALWALGLSAQVHPIDVVAFAYATPEAAAAYERANLDYFGHPTLGGFTDRRGVVSVLDLRQAIKDNGHWPSKPIQVDLHGAEYHRRQKRRRRS